MYYAEKRNIERKDMEKADRDRDLKEIQAEIKALNDERKRQEGEFS